MNPSSSSKSSTQTPTQRAPLSRPGSSLSRPSSRYSNVRPGSTLSAPRPASSASHRPQSRLSQRPQSRNSRLRILPHCRALVSQIAGVQDPESDEFQEDVENVVRRLETTTMNKASASVDMSVIDAAISGHSLKARVNLNEAVSQGLQNCYEKLKAHIEDQETDLDATITRNRIPDHLQLLIALSQPSSAASSAYAELYLENIRCPPPATPPLTWADILAEDPFEGEHWEGVLDPIVVKDDWDSTPSLSPLGSDDLTLDDDDSFLSDEHPDNQSSETQDSFPPLQPKPSAPPYTLDHEQLYDALQSRQYWRKEWHSDFDTSRGLDLGDPSTFGPAIEQATAKTRTEELAHGMIADEKYINEEDMVREVLMALQGRQSVVYVWDNEKIRLETPAPRLRHLSLKAQESILDSLGRIATTLQHLRKFVAQVFSQSANRISTTYSSTESPKLSPQPQFPSTKTGEAFADAIDSEIRKFEAWCAAREEAMFRAGLGLLEEPLVVSLLNTEKSIQAEFDNSFEVLLEIVRDVFGYGAATEDSGPPRFSHRRLRSPASLATCFLDTLFSRLQEHTERNATVTGGTLLRVFIHSSEPIWTMIGKWLRNGMNVTPGGFGQSSVSELEEEFFIEHSGVGIGMANMDLLDPDFWKDGYSLRELDDDATFFSGRKQSVVPRFLQHVAGLALGTGKAIGLVRALGLTPSAHGFATWPSFADLVNSHSSFTPGEGGGVKEVKLDPVELFSVSVDSLSKIIYDQLHGPCEETGAFLVKLLVEDCELWKYVNAIEDLFLMRKGDALSHFLDVIFTKMDANQSWGDLHFLNTAFSDVVRANLAAGTPEWIQLPLVRFAYRGPRDKDKSVNSTVRAIDGLSLEYAVPFPLTYIFRPEIIQVYREIFGFLLQIHRAKHVLERILVREEKEARNQTLRGEMKVFYAMRSRLSWFINTLLNFLTTYVLHVQILKFHEVLAAAKSLDEMIDRHDEHLDRIQGRCLLKTNASALHRAIISILDICIHFTEVFTTFSGDATATLDVSRQSITLKHRSRRQRRQQRNVIGFSHSLSFADMSSDEDEDEEVDPANAQGPGHTSVSYFASNDSMVDDGDFFKRVEKISVEVDGLVRFIRRGVESLAGGSTEAAPTFGVLAFALEDWDL
ncbi:hypothetical protein FA15DRAFT_693484 [Coprinopsis marcescibilis]|uniref:Spindle pole body component n=1 Tax=Coprinopsis marcescibilis TaxID=230819 RepID=A0A5C3KZC0_COPMA|nr:hypothetical protein FA15DRAFT_693484 [Coprinopsis marcescibilis]